MRKQLAIIMAMAILSKVFGFARDIVLSYFYGATRVSDAYLISITIPTTIFEFIGTGLATIFIPMYINIAKDKDGDAADKFTNSVINFMLILCSIIIGIVLLFTEPTLKLFASGFSGNTLDMAVRFTRISIFGIYLSGLIAVFCGYLQLKNNQLIPVLGGLPLNTLIIISIVVSANYNLLLLSIGTILASTVQLICLLPSVIKKGFKYKWVLDAKNPYLKKMIYLSLPVILGVSVNQINILVDRTLASQFVEGGISALTYASRLNLFVQGFFVTTIATFIYPRMARMATEKNYNGLLGAVSQATTIINLFVVPITVGYMIFSGPIIGLLFGRGAFDMAAIHLTSKALFYYSISMLGVALSEVFSKAFYSVQDTKTPMLNAAISMLLNIVFIVVFAKFLKLGISGLALSTSLSSLICTLLLLGKLRKKIGSFSDNKAIAAFVKVLAVSCIMGVLSRGVYDLSHDWLGSNLSLLFAALCGALIYLTIIYFMRIEEIDQIATAVRRRFSKMKQIDPLQAS